MHGSTLPAAVADALRRHGHVAQMPAEIELNDAASVREILETAHRRQLDILTTDAQLAETPFELNFAFGRCIVYLQLEGGDVEQDDAIDRLFKRYKRLSPGRLYTVTASRVKIRQLPGKR